MKKYFQIPEEIMDAIIKGELTRNQSFRLLASLSAEDKLKTFVKTLYYKKASKFQEDLEVIKKYTDQFQNLIETNAQIDRIKDNHKGKKAREKISDVLAEKKNRYYKIKIYTLEQIFGLQDIEMLTLNELRIFMFFLKLYLITFKRDHSYYLDDLSNKIFGDTTQIHRKNLLDTIEKLNNLVHLDGSRFIKKYEIIGHRNPKIYVWLTEKTNMKR